LENALSGDEHGFEKSSGSQVRFGISIQDAASTGEKKDYVRAKSWILRTSSRKLPVISLIK